MLYLERCDWKQVIKNQINNEEEDIYQQIHLKWNSDMSIIKNMFL